MDANCILLRYATRKPKKISQLHHVDHRHYLHLMICLLKEAPLSTNL